MNEILLKLDKEFDIDININYKTVCEILIKEDIGEAKKEFRTLTKKYFNSNNILIYRIFLNSLVYAIFHYVLYTHDISLYNSCHHCTIAMHKDITKDDFLPISDSIIETYYNEMLEKGIIVVNPFLKNVFEYIDENLDKPIGLDHMSQVIHVNKSYLSQLFKNKTGMTFSTYVNNRKLNRARELLIKTDLSVPEISRECGYKNPNYFSTIFTKKMGISPGSFRKNSSVLPAHTEKD